MRHLKSVGKVVYLKLSYQAIRKRLGNLKGRGVVLEEGQTLLDLYEERVPLYEKYADIVVDEEGRKRSGRGNPGCSGCSRERGNPGFINIFVYKLRFYDII